MDANQAKRIEAAEAASAPQRIIFEELKMFELSETFEQYLIHLFAESVGRKLAALMPHLKLPGGKGIKSKAQSQTAANLRYWMSRWYRIGRLIVGLNSTANESIFGAQERLDLTEVILRFKSVIRVSHPTVRWTNGIDPGKFAALLVRARDNITSNLSGLQALNLACECISGKYANPHKLLHKTFAFKIEELHKRTLESVQEYERARKELLSGPVPSGTEWPQDFCEVDFSAVEKLATSECDEIVRMLEVSAKAQMFIAFDQGPEALETLKPNLEGGGDPEKD